MSENETMPKYTVYRLTWISTARTAAFMGDEDKRDFAYLQLYIDGMTVDEISSELRVDEWLVRRGILGG